jgi:hypothetical protein
MPYQVAAIGFEISNICDHGHPRETAIVGFDSDGFSSDACIKCWGVRGFELEIKNGRDEWI